MQEPEQTCRQERSIRPQGAAAILSPQEREAVGQGRLFRRLPPELHDAIVGRAYVWRLKNGERVLKGDAQPEYWIGVASGELLGRTRSAEAGQDIATHLLAPGAWLTLYSPLCGVRPRGIEFVASGPTCVLALGRADVVDLCARWPVLIAALLNLSAINLRYANLVLQEALSCTLEQKLLRWLDSAVRFNHARPEEPSHVYRSVVPQSALASSAGVSRQSWNAGMARLEAAGIVERVKDGLRVPELARLEAAMKQHGLSDAIEYLEAETLPLLPQEPQATAAQPIASLRSEEQAALSRLRWCTRLDAPLREELLSKMLVLRLPDKAVVGAADRLPPGWVSLVSGGLRVMCRTPSAPGSAILAQLRPGATFFEHALVDGGHSGVDVACEGHSTLLLMPADDFRAALAAHASFSLNALEWLGFNQDQAGRLKLILTLPMPLRLHAWLDLLARQRGRPEGDWTNVSMELCQREIAAWLSTTRQYVAKALNELEAKGELQRRRGAFLIRTAAMPLAGAPMTAAHC